MYKKLLIWLSQNAASAPDVVAKLMAIYSAVGITATWDAIVVFGQALVPKLEEIRAIVVGNATVPQLEHSLRLALTNAGGGPFGAANTQTLTAEEGDRLDRMSAALAAINDDDDAIEGFGAGGIADWNWVALLPQIMAILQLVISMFKK